MRVMFTPAKPDKIKATQSPVTWYKAQEHHGNSCGGLQQELWKKCYVYSI